MGFEQFLCRTKSIIVKFVVKSLKGKSQSTGSSNQDERLVVCCARDRKRHCSEPSDVKAVPSEVKAV